MVCVAFAGALIAAASALAQSLTVNPFVELNAVTSQGALVPGTVSGGPIDVAVDGSGKLYVLDQIYGVIRTVTPAGVQGFLAGSGLPSLAQDGTGAGATFWQPSSLAVDSAGTVYVSDAVSVRRVTSAGVVTTIARYFGGKLAVDRQGNLFAARDSKVGRIMPDGTFVALAGSVPGTADGAGVAAQFGEIYGMAIDAAGNIYVSEPFNQRIRKVTPAGVVTTFAGQLGSKARNDGSLAAGRFLAPSSLACDANGNLFVIDGGALRHISTAGQVSTVVGSPLAPPSSSLGVGVEVASGIFGAVAVDAGGTVYLSAFYASAVRKAVNVPVSARVVYDPQSQTIPAGQTATFSVGANGNPALSYQWQRQVNGSTTWAALSEGGSYSGTTSSVMSVSGVTTAMSGDSFRVVVSTGSTTATSAAARLSVDAPVVVVPLRVSTIATPGVTLAAPQGVALDAVGNIYVADMFGRSIRKIAPSGTVSTLATGALLEQPTDVAVDAAGTVYVADGLNCAVYKIPTTGPAVVFAGSPGARGGIDGTGTGARFNSPTALVVDGSGNVFVADTYNHAIRRITPAGVVTTLAGKSGTSGYADGTGTAALFNQPQGLGIDSTGNLFVADWVNHTIRKVTPSGVVTTIAGGRGVKGALDGRADLARFDTPTDVAVDATGNLFVTDSGNNAIRKISPTGIVSTVAGIIPTANVPDTSGRVDAIGPAARLAQPRGLAIDQAGRVVFSQSPSLIRQGVPVNSLTQGQTMVLTSIRVDDSAAEGYQWLKDSAEIPGANGATLSLDAVRSSDTGNYQLRVGTGATASLSEPVAVAVEGSRIANLSIRSAAGSDAQTLTVGFVIANDSLPILVRGIGPGLTQFGVVSALADPRLLVYRGSQLIDSNDNWSVTSGVAAAAVRTGAFPLLAGSLDAATLTSLSGGAFTAQCSAAGGGTGIALIELYDASLRENGRLINVSARSQVGAGEGVLIAGFNIIGNRPKNLLIRGVGPGLATFGLTGLVADPLIKVFDQTGLLLAQNDNWGDKGAAESVVAAEKSVGAFLLPEGSKDAVLQVTLQPGTYSAQLSSASANGLGLIEIYELPP